jgi:hypothetical protein
MIDTNDIAALADVEARPQMQPDNAGRDQAGRFVKGVSGNPKGMPKGNSGPTHEAIAERVGLSRPQVTNIICGRFGASRPIVRRVLELARAA